MVALVTHGLANAVLDGAILRPLHNPGVQRSQAQMESFCPPLCRWSPRAQSSNGKPNYLRALFVGVQAQLYMAAMSCGHKQRAQA